ncbi:hypothetical protein VTO73DRAFT_3706 [Trametes versicolor]
MLGAADAAAFIEVRNRATDYYTGYSSAAALAFLAWDVCVFFPKEAHLRGELVLFAYFVFPYHMSVTGGKPCWANTTASAIILEGTSLAVEVVLLVRVHALYNRSRVVLFTLAGLAASF